MIPGEKIYLRPMELADVPDKVKWVNDEEIRKTLGFSIFPVSQVATEQWLIKAASDSTRRDFIVCLKTDDTAIGFAGLKNIDPVISKAESYLGIGAKEHWGNGYGYDIKKTLLIYAFDELLLNKVYSYQNINNHPMMQINYRLGAKHEGTLRQDMIYSGKLVDMAVMSVLKNEMNRT